MRLAHSAVGLVSIASGLFLRNLSSEEVRKLNMREYIVHQMLALWRVGSRT